MAPQGWQRLEVPLPGDAPLPLRIEVSAGDARARNLGLAGELRR